MAAGARIALERRELLERAKSRLDRLELYPRPVRIDARARPRGAARSSGCRGSGASTATRRGTRSSSASRPDDEDLICHELCHVWQMQHHPSRCRSPTSGRGYAANRYEAEARRAVEETRGEAAATGAEPAPRIPRGSRAGGRLRQRRPGRRGRRARGARPSSGSSGAWRHGSRSSASSRCATGSSRGSVLDLCIEDCRAAIAATEAERTCCSGSRWAARSRSLRRRAAGRRRCSGWRRGSPTGSTSRRSAGKRLDVLHGSLDRYLPGIPGVSPALSRRGFERAQALGVDGSYTLIRGGVHGLAVRGPGGRPVPLPRAGRWARLVRAQLDDVRRPEPDRSGGAASGRRREPHVPGQAELLERRG